MRRLLLAVAAAAVSLSSAAFPHQAVAPATHDARVDAVFARWTPATPGCAAGAAVDGRPVLEKAYGMADLEHDVRNVPDTIFEAGSVSKQFTSAAVLLLARDGKLSLDDPARTYLPELPDYGAPLTIRHMLTHTSGLRDWGNVAQIAGWPRGTRVHTHDHVLDIVSRQRALNFTPGTRWSYSNTGYNLAAIIVSRVSGTSFADFCRTRIFEPLGMTHTSWRDDYTRVVKNRAIAYDQRPDGFHEDMPFENIHGNGGLLTTVGDLLRWNENFTTPKVGDAAFARQQQEVGHFNDGKPHEYALGLMVLRYKGVAEVSHSGATAGYRSYVARYPDRHLSVAVLCNAGNANAGQYAHAIADEYLGEALNPKAPAAPRIAEAQSPLAGYTRQDGYAPPAAELAEYGGSYSSDEAETTFTVAVQDTGLVMKQRPARVIALEPLSKDVFRGSLGVIKFRRGADGRVTELSVIQDRVWDLRFTIAPSAPRPGTHP
jgi:CubicO group peptidase (beta-lactamase class C family)